MKALSLLQPWATLVAMGIKTIETRSWRTPYRGDLLIHASAGKAGGLIALEPVFKKHIPDFRSLPFGALIGKVILTDVVPVESLLLTNNMINKLTMEERAFGDYSNGRYAWLLEEASMFQKPIPVKGSLGIWNYDFEGD